MPSEMGMFITITVFIWLFFVFLATLVYFIFLRGRLRYIVIFLLVTIGVFAIASVKYYKGVQKTKRVTNLLKDGFNESSRLEVSHLSWSDEGEDEKIVYKTQNPEDIQKIAELLSFGISLNDSICKCTGDMRFDLYKGDQLHLSFTLHHQHHIRIKGFSFGDVNMTPESIEKLKKWQVDLGITKLLEEQDR
ncbi:MAG: hypothetical protein FVQ82_11390 [Planctomycetes bacterium]|nr:hypothetical protein [Planctomycetota bacterium]